METFTHNRLPAEGEGTRYRFQQWRRQVLYGVRKDQLEAVRSGFPEAPELAPATLGNAATCEFADVRLAAIETLERHGAAAAPVLAAVLQGRYGSHLCRRGRLRAVEALGRIGGGAELPVLVAYLQGCLEPSRGWRWKWAFTALVFTAVGAFYLIGREPILTGIILAFSSVAGSLFDLCGRWRREREIRIFAAAVRSMSGRVEATECRSLIPGLTAAATDVVTQTAGARRTCRELAETLEKSTAVRTLPIAAAPPASEDLPHLPLPASAQAMDPVSVPRVHEDAR